MRDSATVMKLAWAIHKDNGHPRGYEGACWGPTEAEKQQAREALSATQNEPTQKEEKQ